MAKARKTWQEKLADSKDLPRVVEITDKMSKRWGTGTLVIPAPREVDEIMRKVPRGKLITINQIRELIAKSTVPASVVRQLLEFLRGLLPMLPKKQPPKVKETLLPTGGH